MVKAEAEWRMQSRQYNSKTALQLQLIINICTIAAHNPGKPEMAKVYFDQHLLSPPKGSSFKGKLNDGETKEVCTFKYSEGKRFHILNTGTEPIGFQMSLNGIAVGRMVMAKPREKSNEPFHYFSSDGDALMVINNSGKPGRYMIWEITKASGECNSKGISLLALATRCLPISSTFISNLLMRITVLLLSVCLALFFGCKKEKPVSNTTNPFPIDSLVGIIKCTEVFTTGKPDNPRQLIPFLIRWCLISR